MEELSVTLNGDRKFEATSRESILESATKHGINLPYSCRTGRCSTCKCRVISGKTRVLSVETGLTSQEQSDGWILSCVRAAETDLVLDTDDLGDVCLPTPKTLPCRINEIQRVAPDVMRVCLRLPPATNFEFIAGQYVEIIGPKGIRRSYSIANGCTPSHLIELHIRQVPNGKLSQYWFNEARINDLLRLHGPLGSFFLRETANVDLFFLATGTGIAPVKAILESMSYLVPDQCPNSVTVFWGGRHSKDLYFDVAQLPSVHTYIPVQSGTDELWNGAKGYVQDVLLGFNPDLTNAAIYACGSDAMIRSAKERLVGVGLQVNRFYSDAFVSSESI